MATIISHSAAETFEHGRTLAADLRGGEVFALTGDLGAGKTHLSKGLAAGLGYQPEEVTSPTFTLVHEYHGGKLPVFHFDFYRLENEAAALELGLDEYLEAGGVVMIEWADKFRRLLPAHTRWIALRHSGPEAREIMEE